MCITGEHRYTHHSPVEPWRRDFCSHADCTGPHTRSKTHSIRTLTGDCEPNRQKVTPNIRPLQTNCRGIPQPNGHPPCQLTRQRNLTGFLAKLPSGFSPPSLPATHQAKSIQSPITNSHRAPGSQSIELSLRANFTGITKSALLLSRHMRELSRTLSLGHAHSASVVQNNLVPRQYYENERKCPGMGAAMFFRAHIQK